MAFSVPLRRTCLSPETGGQGGPLITRDSEGLWTRPVWR
jgi:hypothetical protein